MASRNTNSEKAQSGTLGIVLLVLLANALIVGVQKMYHDHAVVASATAHAQVLRDIETKNDEVKNEILALEGVFSWEETMFASSTARE